MNASLFQGISEMFSVLKMSESSIKPEITSWYVKAFIKLTVLFFGSDRGLPSSRWGTFPGGSDHFLLHSQSSKSSHVEMVDELFFYKWDLLIVFTEGH